MNNSKIAIDNVSLELDEPMDTGPLLRQRETELIAIIEALENIQASDYWKLLKDKLFDGVVESLRRRLLKEKDSAEIFRLQGQVVWAEKYSDLSKLTTAFRNELANVKSKLNG